MTRSNTFPPLPTDLIADVCYTDLGDRVKASVRTTLKCRAVATLCGQSYFEQGNLREPYHFKDHVFLFPKKALFSHSVFSLVIRLVVPAGFEDPSETCWEGEICFHPDELASYEARLKACDRSLSFIKSDPRPTPLGTSFVTEHYETADGEPVVMNVFTYDPSLFSTVCGTAKAGFAARESIDSVIHCALAEEEKGRRVLAAFNADFFDMFGALSPAGLCIKDGVVIANPNSDRPFFGVKKNGKVVIDTLNKTPRHDLAQAVGGYPMLVENGEILPGNLEAGERFGETPHPRTLVGQRADGQVVLVQIDGRRPWYSCGATLYECALLLKARGVVRGLNLDGGGSSTCILRMEKGALEMLNHPTSLKNPFVDRVRSVFNALLILEQ